MSWGLVAVAGATVVGGVIGSQASKGAAKSQAQASSDASAAQERMFERSLEIQEPYREAGYEALAGLQQLTDPAGRAEMLQQYYASPEYMAQAQQAEEATLRAASATGGLRSGTSYSALQEIAPQLGQQYLTGQYNQLTGLANLGMGAASQGAAGAQSLGASQAQLGMQAAQARAQGQMQQAQIWSDTLGSLAGLGYGYTKGYI